MLAAKWKTRFGKRLASQKKEKNCCSPGPWKTPNQHSSHSDKPPAPAPGPLTKAQAAPWRWHAFRKQKESQHKRSGCTILEPEESARKQTLLFRDWLGVALSHFCRRTRGRNARRIRGRNTRLRARDCRRSTRSRTTRHRPTAPRGARRSEESRECLRPPLLPLSPFGRARCFHLCPLAPRDVLYPGAKDDAS